MRKMFWLPILSIAALTLAFALLPVLANPSGVGFGDAQSVEATAQEALAKVSPETKACLNCHADPNTVKMQIPYYDWLRSKHAWHTPDELEAYYRDIFGEDAHLASKFKGYPYVVGCYECHGMFADSDRADVVEHNGFKIVVDVTPKDCQQCHYKETKEMSWSKHSFAALNANLKPWYTLVLQKTYGDAAKAEYDKIFKDVVEWPFYKKYAEDFYNGDEKAVNASKYYFYGDKFKFLTGLYPSHGMLTHAVTNFTANYLGVDYHFIMEHPKYNNSYVYLACMECHGSAVLPAKPNAIVGLDAPYAKVYGTPDMVLLGWPNNGAGRINPDGSLGSCATCHTRHTFSISEARKPHTCGQCHLGYDHPQIEIYEESKHGNIYDSEGEEWNWSNLPWRPGIDFRAPTCATCHMSHLVDKNGKVIVAGTHDLGARLTWEIQAKWSFGQTYYPDPLNSGFAKKRPDWKNPLTMGNAALSSPDNPRGRMMSVCKTCHSSDWVYSYFTWYDSVNMDYNITWNYALSLLKKAYKEGIQVNRAGEIIMNRKALPGDLDEYMEIMTYYIWHHEGRRWRMGASMMGPDYTHWLGIVDTVMDKLGRMTTYYETQLKMKQLESKIEKMSGTGIGTGVNMFTFIATVLSLVAIVLVLIDILVRRRK